ncbi:MAG: hypothetical protein ACI9DM_000253 [Cyclobacteriaceae bacterium]|jgi:hypothetical protein
MIQKNGKKYTPTATERKTAEKLYDKNGHLVLVWHESRMYVDPQEMRATKNAEKSRMSPPGLPISPETTVFNKEGETDTYRYYTSSAYNTVLKREFFEPKALPFKDKLVIEDPELKLFFALYSPLVSNSIGGKNQEKYSKNYRPWLKIEIEEKVAAEKINKRQLKNQVDNWILEIAEDDQIREIAAQYKVFNTVAEDPNILRDKLFKLLENTNFSGDMHANYVDFQGKIEKLSDPELKDKVSMVISQALEANAIKYVNQSKCWNIVDAEGNSKVLVKLNANQVGRKADILEKHLQSNPSVLKEVVSALPTKEETENEDESPEE